MREDIRETKKAKSLDVCGCCSEDAKPSRPENPPCQDSLNYRMKVHSTFLKEMISRVSQPQSQYGDARNPLSNLCTRKRDDPAIALIDAWAAVGDVLTFYQERICNEGFIRTAKEPRSVLELARSIGYEQSPGVAASTSLSFVVDDSPGAPFEAVIPKGTQVESVPGPGELPQVFETKAEITARSEWNEMRPRLSRPQPLDPMASRVSLEGLQDIERGDYVLFVGAHLFCWEEVPGADNIRLIEFLADNFGINWIADDDIKKNDENNRIEATRGENSLQLCINDQRTEAILEINCSPAAKFLAKIERNRTNVYVYSLKDNIELSARRVLNAAKDPARSRTLLLLDNPEEPQPSRTMNLEMAMPGSDQTLKRTCSNLTPAKSAKLDHKSLNEENINRVFRGGDVWRENDLAAMISIRSWDSRSVLEYIKKGGGRAASDLNEALIQDRGSRWRQRRQGQESLAAAGKEASPDVASSGEISGADLGLFVFQVKSSPFGHNAPRWDSLPESMRYRRLYGPKAPFPINWDDAKEPPITVDSRGEDYHDAHFFLERSLPEIVPDDWMLLEGWPGEEPDGDSLKGTLKGELKGKVMTVTISGTINDSSGSPKAAVQAIGDGIVKGEANGWLEGSVEGVIKKAAAEGEAKEGQEEAEKKKLLRVYRISGIVERTIADFALTGKAMGLTLKSARGDDGRASLKDFKIRSTNIFGASRRLELTEIPVDDPIEKGQHILELNGFFRNLERGQLLVITGERKDLEGVTCSEVVALNQEAEHRNGLTTIYFEPPLMHPYKRETVKINANVVMADHGETTREVLGSGNGSAVNQEFILKKKPLTYVLTPNPMGREAALKIEVDSLSWMESPSFLEEEDIRERYVIRIDHNQRAHVIFGDGINGARLPTGIENIVAEYRSGIGRAGMVASDRLSLLKARPHGIRSVTNPLPASGGQDPEDMDQTRMNSRLKILNVDRIVSLKDFENFSLNYPGIGKAAAVMLARGEQNVVHITVATALAASIFEMMEAGEAEVEALATHALEVNSNLFNNFVSSMRNASDSVQPFIVNTYEPCFFNIMASVQLEEKYNIEIISQKIRERLEAAFSFSQRDFSQPVYGSEIISTIQNVEGVAAVKLDQFYIFGKCPENALVLEAKCVAIDGDEIEKAELLLINPKGIDLEVRKQ